MRIRRLTGLLLLGILILVNGCDPDLPLEPFTRVQLVPIPGYSGEHYAKQLLSQDEIVRYTALANLIEEGFDYGKIVRHGPPKLGAAEFEEKTRNHQNARKVLADAQASLDHPAESIQSAALLFVSAFLGGSNQHEEICPLIGRVEAVGDRSLFEQLRLLQLRGCDERHVSERVLDQGLASANWNVRGTALLFLGQTDSADYQPEIIEIYSKTESELERLLLLNTMASGYTKESFHFITDQLTKSSPGPTQDVLLSILPCHEDQRSLYAWLVETADSLDRVLLGQIMENYMQCATAEKDTFVEFISYVLSSGSQSLIGFWDLDEIYEGVYDIREGDDEYAEFMPLRQVLEHNPNFFKNWSAYKAGRIQQDEQARIKGINDVKALEALLPEYYAQLTALKERTRALALKAGENSTLINEHLVNPLDGLETKLHEVEQELIKSHL